MILTLANICKILSNTVLLTITILVLECFYTYQDVQENMLQKDIRNYYDLGNHINKLIIVYLVSESFLFLLKIYFTFWRFCTRREKNKKALKEKLALEEE
jgi:hypothetical protein